MIIIACIDDNNGMMFNHRRQSQDRVLRADLLALAAGKPLRMNAYSHKQFAGVAEGGLLIDEDFLSLAQEGDFCFVEDISPLSHLSHIEQIILYRWNRVYPADLYFDLPVDTWTLVQTQEFPGSSHEKITKEVYIP